MPSSTSLYTVGNTANVSGANFTTLYSGGGGSAPVPAEPYGNANVEAFLAAGTDGANTVGNITANGIVSATGNIVTDQYFIGTFLGNITGNFVVPGFNTQVIYNNNGNAGASSGLTFVAGSNTLTSGGVVSAVGNVRGGNITTVGKVSATGNITTDNYFLGNGSLLTGLPATYGNANVSAYLASGTNTANIITSANVQGGNIKTVGQVTATGNVTGAYILGNGSQLTGLPATYGNADVAAFMANFGANSISTTGNVTAGYFAGNGSLLTNITGANVTGTVANATYALTANAATFATTAITANTANTVAGANVTGQVANALVAGTVYTAAQPNITSVGILTAVNTSGNISATGNITGAYLIGNITGNVSGNSISVSGNITGGNLLTPGAVSATGNVTGAYIAGNGSLLTNITGANVTGTVANATFAVNANAATFAGTVTTAAQPNITSVGILTSASISGNTTTGNLNTAGSVSANGNVTAAYLIGNITGNVSGNSISVSGNITGGNLLTSGAVTATGNVTGAYIAGNGSLLTNITGANVTGTVANATTAVTAGTVTSNAQANITSVGTLTGLTVGGNISATGNVTAANFFGNVTGNISGNIDAAGSNTQVQFNDTGDILGASAGFTFDKTANLLTVSGTVAGGNLTTGGAVSATGNVTGAYIIGNGSLLTNITGANVTGNVLNAQFVTQPAQANITSVGTLTSLSVTGNTTSGNISAVGNINGANLTLTADALIQGNLTVNGNTTFINSNVVTINDKFINVANNASTAAQANGGGLGVGPVGTEYATLQYLSTPNVWSTNIGLSVNGNVSAGNVSATGIAGTLSTAAQPNITSVGTLTSLSVTGNVSAGNLSGTNVTGTLTTAAQPNITSVGTLSSLSVSGTTTTGNLLTSGAVSATGNVTGAYIIGNGSLLTNITGANVTGNVLNAQFVTQPAQANITSVGTLTSLSVSGNVTAGNVIAPNFQAVNSAGATLKNSSGTTQAAWGAGAGDNFTISVSTNINGANAQIDISPTGNSGHVHIKPTGTPSVEIAPTYTGSINNMVIGNITPAAVSATTVSATGNITAPNFIGNIIGNVDAGGSNTQVQFNDNDILNGSAGLTFDKTGNLLTVAGNVQAGNLRTAGLVSATGNITGSAVFATGNSTVGNLDLNNINSGNNGIQIIPDNSTLTANATGGQPGRVVIGNGLSGNLNGGAINIETVGATRLVTYDSVTLPQSQTNPTRVASISSQLNVDFAGTSWTNKRATGYRSDLIFANGNVTSTSYNAIRAAAFNTIVGAYTDTNSVVQGSPANITVVSGVTSGAQASFNSTIGNAINFISIGAVPLGNASNISTVTNQIGFASSSLWTGTGAANANSVIHYYAAGTTNPFGLPNMSTPARSATNYYFLKNDDAVAQTQLGSLRSYNEFRYDTATSGTISIDKTNAQVQYIAPTANVTISGYANMVTSLSDGVNTDQEIDTLTILVQQGATPYTVTLPTGATYQYAGNISTVPAVANARSILTVVAANVSGTVNYFTTVQSDQTTQEPAAGANTQIQFNNSGVLAGNAAMTFETVTGNIGLGNLIIGSNATGNANTGGSAQRINTIGVDNGTLSTATALGNGQIVIGNGWQGNLSLAQTGASGINGMRGAKFLLWDTANLAESGAAAVRWSGISSAAYLNLTGNIALNSSVRAGFAGVVVGGGTSANTWNSTNGLAGISGMNSFVNVGTGNAAAVPIGNTTVNSAAGAYNQVFVSVSSNVGNAAGTWMNVTSNGNVTNGAAAVINFEGTPTATPTRTYGLYMPGATTTGAFANVTTANGWRAATEYYFLRNNDAVAQTQLGTLRSYNEFRFDTATSGSITIDKADAQVQYIAPTANVTVTGYANMVTSLSDSVNTDQEIDTLTILVQQGATPYTVTLPTGSTYQYAGNISTVPAVANARSILTVVAANIAGTVNYFTTINSDGTTVLPTAGANTQIQFNDAGVMGASANLTFNKSTSTLTSTILSATGNITGGNIATTGLFTSGNISVTGNTTTGNLTVTGITNIGALKTFSEVQYTMATSGTVNVDKNNGQIQYLEPSGNVTIGTLQNFVTSLSGTNQSDTVTVIVKQGATPYTITLPTGNAAIKYASGISTVGNTAQSVTFISISAANVSGSALYLTSVSPEFV
jgi:hypothetical protein